MRILSFCLFVLFAAAVTVSLVLNNQLKIARRQIETISIDPNILQQKLAKSPPAWMTQQIQRDLQPYAAGISRQSIDEIFSGKQIEACSLVRFTIKNGHIAIGHDEKQLYSRHFRQLLACIKMLAAHTKLPDVDFIVSLQDEGNPDLGPCFAFAKKENAASILIPDIKAVTGYGKLRKEILEANRKIPWSQKMAKCFWRGSTTGGYLTLAHWQDLARVKLVLSSLRHPEEIDARFHHIVQCDPEMPKLMRDLGLVSSSVSRPDHMKYKYLVDVDGNSCSYERYFWLLLSNSVVIKQVTPNIQWYYGGLEPYKHFLPVREDLSDLLDQIQWAKDHDDEARSIAENATKFIRENLGPEDTLVYLYTLLQEYARLYR